MDNMMAIIWLVLTIGFVILEAATVQLLCVWFAAGALAAMLVGLLGGALWLQILVFFTVSIVLFAFSTILGWAFQGEQAFSYLFHGRGRPAYRLLYALAVLLGAGQRLDTVYLFSDVCNALMCMPNLVGVLVRGGEAVRAMREAEKS